MSRPRTLTAVLCVILLVGCGSRTRREVVLAEAYVGEWKLDLRKELTPEAPISATLKQGEKVEIVQVRRRFLRVRGANGASGWTTANMLMTPGELAALDRQAEAAKRLPAQGYGKPFEKLNMHAEPHRRSPSFVQITENDRVDVLVHQLVPVADYESEPLIPPPAKPIRKPRHGKEDGRQLVIPRPDGPPVPDNWVAMSKVVYPPPPPPPPLPPELAAARRKKLERLARKNAPPTEEWTLVRTRDGRAGWVLTSRLQLAIPDDVAQYSEGHRITSYFALKQVDDDGQKHTEWLWTTLGDTRVHHQFDGFRVFTWRKSKDRYESAFRESGVVGYFPVSLGTTEIEENRRRFTVPTFSVILREEDGSFTRSTYAYEGWRTRLMRKEPAEKPQDPMDLLRAYEKEEEKQDRQKRPWFEQWKERLTKVGEGS